MTIYLVEETASSKHYDDEHSSVIGIFSTREKTDDYIKKREKFREEHYYDDFEYMFDVYELELDKEYLEH